MWTLQLAGLWNDWEDGQGTLVRGLLDWGYRARDGGGVAEQMKQGGWEISTVLGRTAVHPGGSLPLGEGFV